jgi:hypothetical protein
VDAQDVIDVLVAKGRERLQELEASLPDRVTEAVNHEGLPEHRGPRGPRPADAPADDANTPTTDAGA